MFVAAKVQRKNDNKKLIYFILSRIIVYQELLFIKN